MAVALEFNSVYAINKVTPNGGKIAVGVGDLTYPDGEDTTTVQAVAIQVTDIEGTKIAEFALQHDSFLVLLEAMMELFEPFKQESQGSE